MPRPLVWTVEMDVALFKMVDQGLTDVEIGRKLDKSPESIQVRRCKLKISRDRFRVNHTARVGGLSPEEYKRWEYMCRLYPDE